MATVGRAEDGGSAVGVTTVGVAEVSEALVGGIMEEETDDGTAAWATDTVVELATVQVFNTVESAVCRAGNLAASCSRDPAAAVTGLVLLLLTQYWFEASCSHLIRCILGSTTVGSELEM